MSHRSMRLLGTSAHQTTPSMTQGSNTSSHTIRSLCGIVTSTEFMSSGPFMTIDFQLNGNNTYRFKFQYYSVEKSGLCHLITLSATRTANYITSPGYPYNYPGGLDCQWMISSSSNNSVIVLKVVDFDLSNSSHCTSDNVLISYGENTMSDLIQTLCGQVSNTQFISTDSRMAVYFHSDFPENFIGFALEYTSKEKSELCGNTTLTANGTANYITTPNYPTNYPGDLDCEWTITTDSPSQVVVLNVLVFNLEKTSGACLFEKVVIFDGNSPSSPEIVTLCNHLSPVQFSSSGSTLTVVYTSKENADFRNFKIEYTSKAPSAVCTENLVANISPQFFTSPGYSFNYQNNLDCQWTITTDLPSHLVVLLIINFDVEYSSPCIKDFVTIYDGSGANNVLCGIQLTDLYLSTGSNMTVEFHSDSATNSEGFKFRYYSQVKPGPCGNNSLIASGVASYITSPNYPNNYDSNSDCQWTITADLPYKVVELTLLDFQVEYLLSCNDDFVTIYDGTNASSPVLQTLCAHHTSGTYTSTGPSMTIMFHSGRTLNTEGFKFEYTSQIKTIQCPDAPLLATKTAATLTSSNYPRLYPSIMTCTWKINTNINYVVVLTLEDFNLNGGPCTSEYVKIYDGMTTSAGLIETLCGQLSKGQYISTTPFMIVEFHSEGGNNNNTTGFHFTYQSKNSGSLATAQITILSLILIIYQLLY